MSVEAINKTPNTKYTKYKTVVKYKVSGEVINDARSGQSIQPNLCQGYQLPDREKNKSKNASIKFHNKFWHFVPHAQPISTEWLFLSTDAYAYAYDHFILELPFSLLCAGGELFIRR